MQVYKYKAESLEHLKNAIRFRYKNQGEADAVASRGRQYAEDYFDVGKVSTFLKNVMNTLN
jgi:hypothetical protein